MVVMLTSCDLGPPDLVIDVCGDVRVPVDIDSYRITVYESDRETLLLEGVKELVECPAENYLSLPRASTFESPEEEVWVIVEALRDGVTTITFETRVQDTSDDTTVKVPLTRDCIGIRCPLGQTCVQGECTLVEYGLEGSCSSAEDFVPEDMDVAPEPFCPETGMESEPDAGM